MKKILIINGNPVANSFNASLAEAYANAAQSAGAEVQQINIGELDFNPSLEFGYHQRTELEPDLIKAQELIKNCDHLVWIHPVWWGSLPALTKGFIDRVFLPGFAFKYREDSVWWDKLLAGKTARIITTADQPGFFYCLVYHRPSVNMLKRSVLQFCGIKPVKVTFIGPVRRSTDAFREKQLQKVGALGKREAY